jgi:putative addiction module killer protein
MYGIPYNGYKMVKVLRTTVFVEWYQSLDRRTRLLVDARIERIVSEDHFGTVRRFEGITELKWASGLRVYSAERPLNLILLLGGNKNGQDKDIRKAKRLLSEIDRA